jgi:hypothetical protein
MPQLPSENSQGVLTYRERVLDVDAAVAVGEEDQLERLVEPVYRSPCRIDT